MEHNMPMRMGPMFHVDDMMMPEIKDWEVGKKYKMVVEVEMKSMSKDEDMTSGGFELVAYKPMPDKEPKDMDDKEFEEYQGKEMSKH